jgi:Mrp family chromosome partitioning ATPase
MVLVLQELERQADVLVLDSPPLLAVTDAALLAQSVDGTLVVVDAGSTRRAFLGRAADMLKAANVRCLGVVLNRIMPSRSGYYSYAYQYYYYYSKDRQRRRRSGRNPLSRLMGQGNAEAPTDAAPAGKAGQADSGIVK